MAKQRDQVGEALPLRVGLIEDDVVTRKVIERMLRSHQDIDHCGSWETGEAALEEVAGAAPDVMITDLNLPGISGEECLKALAATLPGVALVVLTSHEDSERVFAALRAGANGYLLKGCTRDDLVAGIKAAHAGGAPLSPVVAARVIESFRREPEPRPERVPLPKLAPRERQILDCLAQGMVPKEVAAELSISYETVRDYLKGIYQKLQVRSQTEAVLRYLDSGNRPGAPPPDE